MVLIVTSAPTLWSGLKQQFEHWGFTHVQLLEECQQITQQTFQPPPILALLDRDLSEDPHSFVLARLLQIEYGSVPIIFLDRSITQVRLIPVNPWMPYPHSFVPNPYHPEVLWQQVQVLLPGEHWAHK
jgi:DNA-binding response OmpR family regulator